MNGKFSLPVVKAIDLIWTSFNREEIHRGYAMLMQAAQQGDADALCFIARCFMGYQYVWSGAGFATDDENASMLMQKSAVMGSAAGVLCCVRSGNFTPTVERDMPFASFKEAFEEIREQADRGNAFCCYLIGNVYFWGDYLMVEPELAKTFKNERAYYAFAYPLARDYFERSFRGRVCAGWGNYCDIMDSGLGDIKKSTFETYYRALAEISPVICGNYGVYIERETGNYELANAYYTKAMQRFDMQATFNLGCSYEKGEGVEKDLDSAFQLFEIAAIGGHPGAQWAVGYYYFEGWGNTEIDYAKAADWFTKGYNNPKDDKKMDCAAYLAVCYQDGLGVVQDDDLAFGYLKDVEYNLEAISHDSIVGIALNALGVAYAYGRGTRQDIESGIEYLESAVKLGNNEAKENLEQLESCKLSEVNSGKSAAIQDSLFSKTDRNNRKTDGNGSPESTSH